MLTLLVTGATDGIGRETARELLANGRRVLVHGRTRERAERTIAALAREQPDSACDAVWADLSRMGEVVELAAQVRALAPALDVLINNAGVYEDHRELTEDGFERTMAVNHFAPFLLTHRLLPVLHAASAARVVTVSSIAHQSGRIDPDDLEFERGFSGYGAYAASKLANVLLTFELARRQRLSRLYSVRLFRMREAIESADPSLMAGRCMATG
ncbi:MAG: SDR family NAD(P)-dependent oxidoreductase [Burkholderiales bacterium]